MNALYTFAVVDNNPEVLRDADPQLRVVALGELAAVAEPVDVSQYEGERLEQNLNDRQWLENAVRHHEKVIEDLLARTAVVPMRFGSIFSDEDGLRSMLEENMTAFASLLQRVRGRTEWGVRILANADALVRQLAPSAKTATSGGDYLRNRRAELEAADQVTTVAGRIADDIHAQLTTAADEAAVLQPRQPSPQLLLSAAYLVSTADHERFLTCLRELQDAHAGVELDLSGPWPAYSFTSADVGGPRG
jgi:Gas vesicle synthesis protein GvpL/GvpF